MKFISVLQVDIGMGDLHVRLQAVCGNDKTVRDVHIGLFTQGCTLEDVLDGIHGMDLGQLLLILPTDNDRCPGYFLEPYHHRIKGNFRRTSRQYSSDEPWKTGRAPCCRMLFIDALECSL